MRRTIRQGYVSLPKTRKEILSRKYPFRLIKEGEFVHPPYKLEELHRVRSAIRHWNRSRNGCLTVSVHNEDWQGHGPCVVVGWPVGGKPVEYAGPRVKAG